MWFCVLFSGPGRAVGKVGSVGDRRSKGGCAVIRGVHFPSGVQWGRIWRGGCTLPRKILGVFPLEMVHCNLGFHVKGLHTVLVEG